MQYWTLHWRVLSLFCSIVLIAGPQCEAWQTPKAPAGNVVVRGAQRVSPATEIAQAPANTPPSLVLTSSNSQPRVNESVNFSGTLRPSPNVAVQYQFQWGDSTSSDWISAPTASHTFSSPGEYSVVLIARAATAAVYRSARAPQIQSQPVVIRVQSAPPAPAPTLSLGASNTQPAPGQNVIFAGRLQPSSNVPIQYQFDWGDGTASDWTSSSVATHSFPAEGTYNVVLIARAGNAIEGAYTVRGLRSQPLAITVRPPPIAHNILLTSNVSQLQVGQTANFSGTVRPPVDGARYRFIWGDQTSSNATVDPNASHSYSAPGTYTVQLLALIGKERIQSNTILIDVRDIPTYRLDLSVNTNEVSVGQTINFTARLQPPNDAAQYRFLWDDGTPTTTTGSSSATHSFIVPGTHAVGVVSIVDGRQVAGNRVSVTVVRLPSAVSLSVNTTSPEVNQSVEFHASLQPDNPRAEYRFDWGDGASSDWSSSATQNHSYTASGTPSASVVVRVASTSVQSAPVTIEVHGPPTPPAASTVSLKANPKNAQLKQPVEFHALLQPVDAQAEYQFDWGDGASSDWSTSTTQRHVYTVAGAHSVFVVARTATMSVQSAALAINVHDGQLPALSISIDKEPAKPGDSVKVIASFGNAEPAGAEYQFIFGDGTTTPWSSARVVDHQFHDPGAYTVRAFGRVGSQERPSNTLIVPVSGPPPPPPPWVKLISALLLVFAITGQAWRMFVRPRVNVRTSGPRLSHISAAAGLVERPEIRLRVVLGAVKHRVSHADETVIQR